VRALGILKKISTFIQGVWVSSSDPANATISESGRLFTSITSGSSMPAYVNRAKTTGKWFFAVELVSFSNNTFVYAVGVDTQATPNTSARGSAGQPNTTEYCYGKFLGSKKWVAGTPTAYGTLCVVGGDFVGISYDASTGEVRGYRWISGAWTDDGVITTLTAGTSCKPYVQCTGGATQSSVRLTSNKAAPSGFTMWA